MDYLFVISLQTNKPNHKTKKTPPHWTTGTHVVNKYIYFSCQYLQLMKKIRIKHAVSYFFLGLLRKSYRHLDGRVPSLCLCSITGICSSQLCFTAAQGVSEASKKAKKTKQGTAALYLGLQVCPDSTLVCTLISDLSSSCPCRRVLF